jgi:iron-sulfur cluster repair protein YtfE (RIC family)
MVWFKEDSINFNIANGNDEDAIKLIKKCYDKSEDPDEILKTLKNKSSKGASNVTLGEACCNPKYKKATWIGFFVCFF